MFKNTIVFVIVFCLNSCSKYKCKAEGKLLFRDIELFLAEDNSIFGCKPNFLSDDLKNISSPEIINLLVQKLNENRRAENYLYSDKLAKELNKKIIGGTNVISLSYKSTDATFATKVVNTWIDIISTEYAKNLQTLVKSSDIIDRMEKDINSPKILDKVVERFSTNDKYQKYISKAKLPQNFVVKIDDNILSISYKRPYFDPGEYTYTNIFADMLVDVLLEDTLFKSYYCKVNYHSPKMNTKTFNSGFSTTTEIEIFPKSNIFILEYADGSCT